jgi:hypothetical protein
MSWTTGGSATGHENGENMRNVSWITGLALAATVFAMASAGAQSGQVYACVNNGVTKIVPAGTTCPNGQSLMSWNVTGPQGPTGPTGPTGPAGPAATAYSVLGDQTFMSPGTQPVLMTAYCTPGDIVTGGGFWNWNAGGGGDRNGVRVSESSATGLWQYPDPEDGDNQPVGGWKVRAQNEGARILILSASVQCLHLGS